MTAPLEQSSLLSPSFSAEKLFPDPSDVLRGDLLDECTRIGIGTTLVDTEGRIIMLAHREGPKTQAGELGPMTETVQWFYQNGMPMPETTPQTQARAIQDELEFKDDTHLLDLRAERFNSWFIRKVPIDRDVPGNKILAICTVVHLPAHVAEELVDTFSPSSKNEIETLKLMRPEEIMHHDNLRPLARYILGDVFRSGKHIVRDRHSLQELQLPAPQSWPDSSDNIPFQLRLVK